MIGEAADPPPSLPAHGYWVQYADLLADGEPPHSFCGENTEQSAVCPNCRLPLTRLLSLEASDARLALGGSPYQQVVLYFCWPCGLSQARFAYRLLPNGAIELIRWAAGPPSTDFPYAGYPRSFPRAAARLTKLSRAEQGAIHALNEPGDTNRALSVQRRHPALAAPHHQVGGEPLLLQGWPRATCPCCGGAAPLLASIADDCLDPRGLIGYAYAQVLYSLCRRCSVVLADNACD